MARHRPYTLLSIERQVGPRGTQWTCDHYSTHGHSRRGSGRVLAVAIYRMLRG